MTKFERATGLVYKQRFGTIRVLSSTSPVIDPVQLPSSGIPDGPRKKLSNQFFFYYKISCIPCICGKLMGLEQLVPAFIRITVSVPRTNCYIFIFIILDLSTGSPCVHFSYTKPI
jgi:hypothetical protein